PLAAAESLDHLAVYDKRTAGIAVALRDFGVQHFIAVARIQCNHMVAACKVELILIDGDPAHRDIADEVVLPTELDGQAILPLTVRPVGAGPAASGAPR